MSDPLALAAALDIYGKAQTILVDWCRKNLVPGEDWLLYHRDRCAQKALRDKIACPECGSKASLLQTGAEKINKALGRVETFHRDQDTWEMLGSKAGVLCYVCELRDASGKVGEGRGARSVAQDGGNENTAVKMCQKSAYVDATLRASGLHALFTQDLEDVKKDEGRPAATPPPAAAAVTPAVPRQPEPETPKPEPEPPPPPIAAETMGTLRQMAVVQGGYPDFQRRRDIITKRLTELGMTKLDQLTEAQGQLMIAECNAPANLPATKNGDLPEPQPTGLTIEQVRAELHRVMAEHGMTKPGEIREMEAFICRAESSAQRKVESFDQLTPAEAMQRVDEARQFAQEDLSALKIAMARATMGQ